jgi:hypothetical protein
VKAQHSRRQVQEPRSGFRIERCLHVGARLSEALDLPSIAGWYGPERNNDGRLWQVPSADRWNSPKKSKQTSLSMAVSLVGLALVALAPQLAICIRPKSLDQRRLLSLRLSPEVGECFGM